MPLSIGPGRSIGPGWSIGGGGAAPAAANDPYFMYNSLLLTGDGTNLSQNNTFVDSSTNNFAITRVGNTTQGTFSPYGENWSTQFTRTDPAAFVQAPANVALNLTADFTLECWINLSSMPTTNAWPNGYWILGSGPAFGDTGMDWFIGSTTMNFNLVNYLSPVISVTHNMVVGVWYHVAISRTGSAVSAYINGAQVATATNSSSSTTGYNWAIGRGEPTGGETSGGFNGYISNFRVIKGTGIYPSAFTPSTTPLTAIANTSLLTCQSNRFIDNSTNAFTLTPYNSPTVQRYSPFSPTQAYSTSVIGGSGYFDGSGDYLSLSQQTALSFGTGDFTVEAWVYPTTNPGTYWSIIDARGSATAVPWAAGLRLISGNLKLEFYTGTQIQGSITVPLNTWTHIAYTRSGTTFKGFVNGVVDINTTMSTTLNIAAGTQVIGAHIDPGYDTGYITDIRVVKGTAVYTSAFTPPSAPVTAISGTSLLTGFTNAGITDSAMLNDLETVGDAKISTAQSKFGGSSLYFDGTGDRLYEPSNQNFNFGTGDFTIELWVYPISQGGHGNSNNDCLIDFRPATGGGAYGTLYIFSSGTGVYWYANTGNRITGGAISNSVWTHIAICRSSGSTKLFLNGTQSGSTYTDATNYLVAPIMIGEFNDGAGAGNFNGYIDDLRVTKGYARYTTTFTPPTAALPTY